MPLVCTGIFVNSDIIDAVFSNVEYHFVRHVRLVAVIFFLYKVDGHTLRSPGIAYLNPEILLV